MVGLHGRRGRLMRWVATLALGVVVAGTTVAVSGSTASAAIGDGLEPMISTSIALVGDPFGHNSNGTVKVDTLAKIGNTLYVGGQFTQLAPERLPNSTVPAGSGIPRPYLFAADATTGLPIWSFNAVLDGPVFALAADAATNTLYVGGQFGNVNGQALSSFAILDATTGALKDGVTQLPVTGGGSHSVRTLLRHPLTNKLYIGGDFTLIGGHNRGEAARLSLPGNTLDNWKLQVNGPIWTIGIDQANPNPARIYVGGEFTAAAGNSSFAFIAAFDSTEPATEGLFVALDTTWDPSITGYPRSAARPRPRGGRR